MAPKRVEGHGGRAPRVLQSAVAERKKKERRTYQAKDSKPPWRTADRQPAEKKSTANVDPAGGKQSKFAELMKKDKFALTPLEASWLDTREKLKNLKNEVDRRQRSSYGKAANDRGSRDQQIRGSGGRSATHSESLVTLKARSKALAHTRSENDEK